MADTSAHDKEMKNFMRAKVFVPGVKNGQFQCVNHTADGVNNTAAKQPQKSLTGQGIDNLRKSKNTYPAHSNI